MGILNANTCRPTQATKRRKLTHTDPSTARELSVLAIKDFKAGKCSCCHRSFPASRHSQLVECARCLAPTCAICARKCNGCPPSEPPTPALTTTPSSLPDTSLLSPLPHQTLPTRRPALAANTNTALRTSPQPAMLAGRRRKVREGDEDEDGMFEHKHIDGEDDEARRGVTPGCGRIVCRNCAFETPERDLTTCYDCADH